MSKSDNSRGSLMALKSNLPRVAAVQTTPEMESRILGATKKDVFTERRKDIFIDEPSEHAAPGQGTHPPPTPSITSGSGAGTALAPVPPASAAGRRKEPTVLMNAKIPYSLHSRLKRTAQFNDISMTDILIRAIETEMASRRYATPPEQWGSDPTQTPDFE
jgi:hypothetical protein